MPVLDGRQPRPNTDDSSTDDRKGSTARPRKRNLEGYYEKYGKAHYEKNKAAYVARAAEARKKGREQWQLYKSTLSCVHCGENHPATFDFHHVVRHPDNIKIHRLLGSGMFKKALKEAQEKCIVLCANCHRKLHWEEDQQKNAPSEDGA